MPLYRTIFGHFFDPGGLWWVSSWSQASKLLGCRREYRFGTVIAQGTIPSGFPVFWVAAPGCSRNSYRTSPNLWVQKKFVKLRQSTKIRDSVRLKSFERFLVTLPSIFSETWDMYSWAIPGSSMFCDWLFLVFSRVSLETASNFLFFLNVVMIPREKFCQLWRLNWVFNFITKGNISSYYEGKVSRKTNS